MRKKIADFYNKHSVAFNVISFLVAIGSICITIWISKQPVTLPQKELSCITSNSKSLVLMLESNSNLKLLYGEREVSNPCITSIIIQNTGAYAVTNEDFLQPFLISFDGNNEILAVNIGECSNSYIKDEVLNNSEFSNQKLIIDDFFLNQGEMFTVDIISDGGIPLIKFDTRINGISSLNLVEVKSNQVSYIITFDQDKINVFYIVSVICGIIAFVSLGTIIYTLSKNKKENELFRRLVVEITEKTYKENQSNESN